MKESEKPIKFNILLIGESGVGKTSIFKRYIFNKYDTHTGSSIGVDFGMKSIKYKNKNYSICLFDTAGQERFRSITKTYLNMGNGVFLVFDLSNEYSLNSLDYWIDMIQDFKKDYKFIIIGNKDDIKDKISDEIINKKLEKYIKNNIFYIKTSAEKNINISLMFEKMIELLEYNISGEKQNNNVKITNNNKIKKSKDQSNKCCWIFNI